MAVNSVSEEAVNTYTREDEEAVLQEMKERLNECWDDWDRIYQKGLECCDMIAGKIFRPDVKAQRIAEGRPVIEVNQLTQYTERVLGDMRLNLPSIKFRAKTPDVAGKAIGERTKAEYDMTDVLSSVVKGIEQDSNATQWYDRASTQMVHAGIGWLRCYPAYKDSKSFDMTIRISGVTNFVDACIEMSREPDFSDARYGFVFQEMPRKEFEARWPDIPCNNISTVEYGGRLWSTKDTVTIAEYFERVAVPVTICRLSDGSVVKKEKGKPFEYDEALIIETRKTTEYKVVWRKVCDTAILEGGVKGIELPFSEIPLVPMVGRESLSEEGRNFESLIVHAMDAQREAAYWRTMMTEQVALQPKAKWIASSAMVSSRRNDWERANTHPLDVLVFDADPQLPGGVPQRVQPSQIAAAEMQQYLAAVQDMKACIGLYDSAIGNLSGEVSGRAILARERQTDIGTYVFVHHRNEAVKRLGRLVLEGIRSIFTDTMKIRIFRPDETTDFVEINKPELDDSGSMSISNDITIGDVEPYVDAGPAFNTLRIEAVNSLMEMANANPQILNIAGDIMADNMDWPGARQFADRLKRFIAASNPQILSPIEMLDLMKEKEGLPTPPPTPEMMMQMQMQQLNTDREGYKAQAAQANAQKEQARAVTAQAEAQEATTVAMSEMQIRAIFAQLLEEYRRADQANT